MMYERGCPYCPYTFRVVLGEQEWLCFVLYIINRSRNTRKRFPSLSLSHWSCSRKFTLAKCSEKWQIIAKQHLKLRARPSTQALRRSINLIPLTRKASAPYPTQIQNRTHPKHTATQRRPLCVRLLLQLLSNTLFYIVSIFFQIPEQEWYWHVDTHRHRHTNQSRRTQLTRKSGEGGDREEEIATTTHSSSSKKKNTQTHTEHKTKCSKK